MNVALAALTLPLGSLHTFLYDIAELALTMIFVIVLITASAIEGYRFIRMKLRE